MSRCGSALAGPYYALHDERDHELKCICTRAPRTHVGMEIKVEICMQGAPSLGEMRINISENRDGCANAGDVTNCPVPVITYRQLSGSAAVQNTVGGAEKKTKMTLRGAWSGRQD